jgi:hypothetical protein
MSVKSRVSTTPNSVVCNAKVQLARYPARWLDNHLNGKVFEILFFFGPWIWSASKRPFHETVDCPVLWACGFSILIVLTHHVGIRGKTNSSLTGERTRKSTSWLCFCVCMHERTLTHPPTHPPTHPHTHTSERISREAFRHSWISFVVLSMTSFLFSVITSKKFFLYFQLSAILYQWCSVFVRRERKIERETMPFRAGLFANTACFSSVSKLARSFSRHFPHRTGAQVTSFTSTKVIALLVQKLFTVVQSTYSHPHAQTHTSILPYFSFLFIYTPNISQLAYCHRYPT